MPEAHPAVVDAARPVGAGVPADDLGELVRIEPVQLAAVDELRQLQRRLVEDAAQQASLVLAPLRADVAHGLERVLDDGQLTALASLKLALELAEPVLDVVQLALELGQPVGILAVLLEPGAGRARRFVELGVQSQRLTLQVAAAIAGRAQAVPHGGIPLAAAE